MRCKECQSLLFDFIDGTLPDATAESIGKHLASCLECAAQFEKERRFSQLVKNSVNHQTAGLGYNPRLSSLERLNTIHQEGKIKKPARMTFALLRPIPLILILLLASTLLILFSPWKFFKKNNLVLDDRLVMEELNSRLSDPLTDWTERRLVVTIYDSNGNLRQTIITSRSEEDMIRITNEEIKK